MSTKKLTEILQQLGGERRINYSLDRFKACLKSLGNPERDTPAIVVAGTNGKGTTALSISATLTLAGRKVGTYLSPHLQDPNERILGGLQAISDEELEDLAIELQPVAQRFELSYFEFFTLIYFVWAKRSQQDISVLEVGLGGRLDATNVTDPLACVLTNISLDHQEYLGPNVESILEEKLGVLNSEGLLFTGVQETKLRQRIEARCNEIDSIYYYSDELRTEVLNRNWYRQEVSYNGHRFSLNNSSAGAIQNSALAFLCLRILFPVLPVSIMQTAFSRVVNPGRMEVVQENPRVILSGDHNPAGVQSLKESLGPLQPEQLKIVCGFSPDKPYAAMLESLKELSTDITLTSAPRFRGALPPEYFKMAPYKADARKAVEQAIAQSDSGDTILVTGSLYLVGEVRSLWHPKVSYFRNPEATSPSFSPQPDVATWAKFPQTAPEQTIVR